MRLSVLDLVPVRVDQSTSDALAATLRLAQTADRLGYTRYWVAEHHNMPAVAATSPPVLIALLGAHTSHLRLGSGGVMLPNHAPLAVAEQFALLEAAYPGRIDLGIGRAPGSDPVTSYMLRNFNGRDGSALQADIDNFPEYLDHVVALMSPHGGRVALIDLVAFGDVETETGANAAPNRHDFLVALERELKRRGLPTGHEPAQEKVETPAPVEPTPEPAV